MNNNEPAVERDFEFPKLTHPFYDPQINVILAKYAVKRNDIEEAAAMERFEQSWDFNLIRSSK